MSLCPQNPQKFQKIHASVDEDEAGSVLVYERDSRVTDFSAEIPIVYFACYAANGGDRPASLPFSAPVSRFKLTW